MNEPSVNSNKLPSGDSPLELATLQRWFQAVIMHPEGVAAGIRSPDARGEIDLAADEIEQVVTRSQARTSLQRLEVYANAYYARLLECLGSEFPALEHAVGEEAFSGFSFGYLQEYPSTSYTLADLGRRFPQYLRESCPAGEGQTPWWMQFVIDLAEYERVCSEVFDAPGPEGEPELSPTEIEAVPPEAWGTARLRLVEPLRLVQFGYPVHEYVSAVRRGEQPRHPAAAVTRLAVTRRDYIVRRVPLSETQYELLLALEQELPLAEALATALANSSEGDESLVSQLGEWFREWAAAGLIRGIVTG